MEHIYPMRYDEAQYDGLKEVARRFGVTGRQKAQRQINQLYMAFFGIVDDPFSATVMSEMVSRRLDERRQGKRRRRKDP